MRQWRHAQEVALRAEQSLFNFGGAPAAGKGANSKAATVAQHHQGGLACTGGSRMRLSVKQKMIERAPRFHGGGGYGLKSDERFAVLQTGERVLSRRRTAAYDAAASGGSMKIEIHNNGAPAGADGAQMGRSADGEQLQKVFLAAPADDVAIGGQIAHAGIGRFG